MRVWVNEITGFGDAFTSLLMSKRTWTREKEEELRTLTYRVNGIHGERIPSAAADGTFNKKECLKEYDKWMQKLLKFGVHHITMLRFIDISVTVEGLHRGGQDDWDSHAMRFNNRIIRTSTRLSKFRDEMSSFYEGKIIPTDVALATLGMNTPDTINFNGLTYVKTTNGYIQEEYKDNKDVKRGLYMLSIPSNFIFKIDLTEWAHVFKERNEESGANPEVKECCEEIARQITKMQPAFDRKLFEGIKN